MGTSSSSAWLGQDLTQTTKGGASLRVQHTDQPRIPPSHKARASPCVGSREAVMLFIHPQRNLTSTHLTCSVDLICPLALEPFRANLSVNLCLQRAAHRWPHGAG